MARSSPCIEGIALIFDMDGVIIDSNPVHREAWRVFNLRHGLETDEAMHQRMYGKRNDEIVRDFYGETLSEDEVRRRGAEKEEIYRQMMSPVLSESLVPGVEEILQKYRSLPLGLGTNAEPANVRFLLDQSGLRPFFRVVVDGHQVRQPKPAPEIYLRVAELLGVPPRNCIVFEDSYSGVTAARAAGARVVGVKTTHLEFKNVDLTVDHFQDTQLQEWIDSQKPL